MGVARTVPLGVEMHIEWAGAVDGCGRIAATGSKGAGPR